MWIASKHGFFSIVKKENSEFHIRARVKRDLQNLKKVSGIPTAISTWKKADYRYRLIVNHAELGALMSILVSTLDYGNFKSMIAKSPDQKEKLHAYHEFWSLMYTYQEEPDERKTRGTAQ